MPALQSVFWSGCSGWNARKIPTEHYGSVRIALSCALKLRAEHVKASGASARTRKSRADQHPALS
jgi:hypothetical protein